jgi:hypothetical protein
MTMPLARFVQYQHAMLRSKDVTTRWASSAESNVSASEEFATLAAQWKQSVESVDEHTLEE